MIPDMKDCNPGMRATGFNVIIALPPQETVTDGGIIIPDSVSDRDRLSLVEGRLVSISPVAFDYANWPNGEKPKVGDAVMYAKFGGRVVKGRDGKEYRIMVDKDVSAIIEEDGHE